MSRPLGFLAPALILLTGCGSNSLNQKTAVALISPDYPVMVPVKVPKQASAAKGSPELTRMESINTLLTQSGWFAIQRREEGAKVHFAYAPLASAPSTVRATPAGFEAPAAEATFVKALRPQGSGGKLKVPYQIRLERPTALFPLFQYLHPQVRLGETKQRFARIDRQGKDWALMDTDEEFRAKKP